MEHRVYEGLPMYVKWVVVNVEELKGLYSGVTNYKKKPKQDRWRRAASQALNIADEVIRL